MKINSNSLNYKPLVGIIDTGFNVKALKTDYSRVYLGSDFIDNDDNPLVDKSVDESHGSQVLQTIDSPSLEYVWLGRAVGSGRWTDSLVEFVDLARTLGHKNSVVNLSFDLAEIKADGRFSTRYKLNQKEQSVIEYAQQNGVIIVTSAGNENGIISGLGQASAEFENVITVGSAKAFSRSPYSSYGDGLTLLADITDTSTSFGGTSISAAKATNVISQIWDANPNLSYQQVINILKTSSVDLGKPGWDLETGFGVLNLEESIELAVSTSPHALESLSNMATIPALEDLGRLDFTEVEHAYEIERAAGFFKKIGNFFKDLGEGIINGVAKIGGVLIDAVTFPFQALGEAIEFVTDKIGDGLEFVFDSIGLDVIGDALDFLTDRAGEKLQGIIERGAQYIEELPSRIERTANDLFSDKLWNNFGRWFSENLINATELLGIPEITETLADLIKFNTRGLTDAEKEIAQSIFGESINLNLVRIDEYSISNLFNGKRPFVTFNTINTWGELDDVTFIHELTHVWQYGAVGAIYIPDSLAAQNDAGINGTYPPNINTPGTSGYRYGGYTELEKRINDAQNLSSFNYEQQATIVEHYYEIREDGVNSNDKYLPLYAHFVQEVSTLSLDTLLPSKFGLNLIVGTETDEQLIGDSRDDTIFGLAGDDFIDGRLGNDRMYGGTGNDTYVVDSSNDEVIEFPNQGTDTVHSFISYTLGDNLENLNLLGESNLKGTGNNIANTITGNSGDNVLDGAEGHDTLSGHHGNDSLIGGEGSDTMLGGLGDDVYHVDHPTDITIEFLDEGNDTVNSSVSYRLSENLENLILQGPTALEGIGNDLDNDITGNDNDNSLEGLSGDDTLSGGIGHDTLNGGSGDDVMIGGTGNDQIDAGTGNDEVDAGAGNDQINGGEGIDTLDYETVSGAVDVDLTTGDVKDDGYGTTDITTDFENVMGSEQNDAIRGDDNANSLFGHGGDDTIIGELGSDELWGNDGNDELWVMVQRYPGRSIANTTLKKAIATSSTVAMVMIPFMLAEAMTRSSKPTAQGMTKFGPIMETTSSKVV